jgi:hypothetical protein
MVVYSYGGAATLRGWHFVQGVAAATRLQGVPVAPLPQGVRRTRSESRFSSVSFPPEPQETSPEAVKPPPPP